MRQSIKDLPKLVGRRANKYFTLRKTLSCNLYPFNEDILSSSDKTGAIAVPPLTSLTATIPKNYVDKHRERDGGDLAI